MGVVALSDLNMRTSPCEAPQSDLVMYAVPEMAFEPPMPAPAGKREKGDWVLICTINTSFVSNEL